MRKRYFLEHMHSDLKRLVERSPMTAALLKIVHDAHYWSVASGHPDQQLREVLNTVTASTDPWQEVFYQSLYIRESENPADRVVLQEPATMDPTVGIMVLKSARLMGNPGMVFCGTQEALDKFKADLPDYEKKGEELSDEDFVKCLLEVANEDGLKIIFSRAASIYGDEDQDV